jgi:acyl-CoA synthetase (AMP-forming)/AMP-acid ligase II
MVYDPNRMAGLQVLMRALLAGEPLVEADRTSNLQERVRFFRASGVTAISATPTLWRQILLCDGIDEWPLTQITLGGEMADQRILDALATRYPSARITHIFAATETGVAFAVSDRLAGFPEEYLDSAPHGVRMRVRNGGLEVHNPLVVDAPADGFIRTGDVVEVREGRIHFLGRDSGAVNVGGVLVWPEQIEVSLREHPDVLDALVSSTSSSFAGNLLMAQVVLAEGSAVTGSDLRAWVRDRWPASHVPARVKVVERLPISAAGKAQR